MKKKRKFDNNITKDLIESEKYTTDIWKFLPLPMAYITPLGVILDIDNAFENFLGYSKEEIIGESISDFSPSKSKLIELQKKTLKKGQVKNAESIIKNKDGKEIPVSISTLARKDERGKIIGYFASFVDLFERKSSEEELRKREAFNLALFEYNPIETIVVDLEGRVVAFNQAVKDARHRLPKIGDIMYRDYAAKHEIDMCKELMNCIKKGKTKEFPELTYEDRIFSITISPFPKGAVVISEDITESKRAEDALRESEMRYRNLAETLQEGLCIADPGENIIFANPAFCEILGYSQEEIVGMNLSEMVPEDEFQKLLQETSKRKKGIISKYEIIMNRKDGELRNIKISAAPWLNEKGEFQGAIGVMLDITEQKHAEVALRESEEKYRDLVENISDVIYALDEDGVLTYVSPVAKLFVGYNPSEVIGRNFTELIYKEDIPRIREGFNRILSGQIQENEYRILTKSGEVRWMRTSSRPIIKGECVVGVQGVLTDVTERKKAEDELKRSEAKSRALLDANPDLMFRFNKDGVFLDYKAPKAEDLYVPPSEFLDRNIDEVMPPELVKLTKHHIGLAIKTGKIQVYEYQLQIGDRLRDFEARMVISGEDEIFSIVRDITERKKMEEELLKFEKLESLGVLAGGIAHDFNNILTGILGNITLVKMDTNPEDEMFRILTDAERATKQAKDLTQQLLTFSRGGAPVKKTIYIGDLIRDSVNFALSGSNCSCEFSIHKEILPVGVDEGQMNQVIQNLIINADQAMPEGGVINVSILNVTISNKDALPLDEGKYVMISIKDHGVGISKEHLKKMFDPYFTTKQRGSGLGLATAYSIVKRHGGHITVESELGVGTIFDIYLPTSKKKIKKRKGIKEKPIHGKGRILLMDDEEVIIETTRKMLERLGYDVEFVEGGEKAIDLYTKAKKLNDPFNVVIMDLTIRGGMGGKETIKKLIEIDPNVTAIVSSGYSTDPIMARYSDYGFKGVVVKPYDIEELSNTLHSVIED